MVKVAPEFREMYPKEKKLIWRRFHSCPVGREFLAEEPVHPFGCCYHYREWVHATTADFIVIDLYRRSYNFVTGNFWDFQDQITLLEIFYGDARWWGVNPQDAVINARPRQGPNPRTHCFYAEIPGAKIRFQNAFNAMKSACDVGASEEAIAAHRTEVITLRDEYNFLCARDILCDLYQKARSPFHFLNRPLTKGDIKSFDTALNNQLREVDGEPDLVFRDDRGKVHVLKFVARVWMPEYFRTKSYRKQLFALACSTDDSSDSDSDSDTSETFSSDSESDMEIDDEV